MCSNLHITPFSTRLKIPVGPEKPDHIRLSVFLSILPPTSLSFFHPTIVDIRSMIHLSAPGAMWGPMLSVKVHVLSGHLCDVTLHPAASVDDLHRAIFVHTNIRIEEQRLFVGEREMSLGLPLNHYQSLSQPDSSRELQVSLVRRDPLQAQWLSSFRTGSLPWVALGDAPVSVKGDKEVVLAAVVQDGKALQFASPELRDRQGSGTGGCEPKRMGLGMGTPRAPGRQGGRPGGGGGFWPLHAIRIAGAASG